MTKTLTKITVLIIAIALTSACKQELDIADPAPVATHSVQSKLAATYDITVAQDSTGNYKTVQEAINATPTGRTTTYKIYIKNGIYKEVVSVPANKSFIQLVGQSKDSVIISYNNYSGKPNPAGGTFNTASSPTFSVTANNFSACNISFRNTSGDKPQAVAADVSGDRASFKNCNFLGGQGTLLTYGSGNKQAFYNCYIEGTVDFIFGNSRAWFDKCTINPRPLKDGTTQSYITAANTFSGQDYGYIFNSCKIIENTTGTKFFLGRPWQNDCTFSPRSKSKVLFVNTTMGSNILPAGWSTWDACTVTNDVTFAEYNSKTANGVPINTRSRVSWSRQLKPSQLLFYSSRNVFGTWSPCSAFSDNCNISARY